MPTPFESYLAKNPQLAGTPPDQLLKALHEQQFEKMPYDQFERIATGGQPPAAAAPDLGQIPPYMESTIDPATGARVARGVGRGFTGAAATALEALDKPGTWLFGPDEGPYSPRAAARALRSSVAPPAPATTTPEKVVDIGAYLAGALPVAVAEWTAGVPYALLHGITTAEQTAKDKGKIATNWEKVRDSLVEGGARSLLGWMTKFPWGRLTGGLAFGAVSGGTSVIEDQGASSAGINAGINFVLGVLGPNITPGARGQINAAREAAARGDGEGAMRHLDPLVRQNAAAIAAAARDRTISDAGPRPDQPAQPTQPAPGQRAALPKPKDSGDRHQELMRQEWQIRQKYGPGPERDAALAPILAEIKKIRDAFEASKKKPAGTELQRVEEGSRVGVRLPVPPHGRAGYAEAKERGEAALSTVITQRERANALVRTHFEEGENLFRGIPDRQRMNIMSAWMGGERVAIPPKIRAWMEKTEKINDDQYMAETVGGGLDYERRKNYWSLLWKDEARADVYGQQTAPRGLGGKPGFTKQKVFNDPLEGAALGFELKNSNPAVLASWRIEAGNNALTRILAMKDFVADGIAIPEAESHVGVSAYMAAAGGRKPPNAPPRAVSGEYAGWQTVDVGGVRYKVHPAGKWLLENALGIDRKSLSQMLGFNPHGTTATTAANVGHAWMAARNATIPAKLSLSAFHAIHELGIQVFQPFTAVFEQALNRRLTFDQFLKGLKDPQALGAYEYGRRLSETFSKPAHELSPQEQVELNLMVAGGFSPQRPSVYEIGAERAWRRMFNDIVPSIQQKAEAGTISRLSEIWQVSPQYAKAGLLLIGRGMEAMQGPLFSDWIPAMKAAAYLNQAKQVLAARPELLAGTPESTQAMRQELRKVQESIDNRFGEMQYDKVFMPYLLKRALMGSMLSVGWNYGFLREFGGGIKDAAALGYDVGKHMLIPALQDKALHAEVTTRMVYASVYSAGALIVGGMMTWMFTGEKPKDMKDLIYPRLPDGSRLNTQFFTREFGAIYYHMQDEGALGGMAQLVINKLNPLAGTFMDVLEGHDYMGNQIVDPNASAATQAWQAMKYGVEHTAAPISVESLTQKGIVTPSAIALSLGGYNPAPKYVDRPAFNSEILRNFRLQYPGQVVPFAEVERHGEIREAKKHFQAWRQTNSPQENTAWRQLLANYVKKHPEYIGKGGLAIKQMLQSWLAPDNALQFRALDRQTQIRILTNAPPELRKQFAPYAHPDVKARFSAP